jgi:hypothetical protein
MRAILVLMVLAACFGLLNACAPMHWAKDGADATATQQVLSACSGQAKLRAQAEASFDQTYVPMQVLQTGKSGFPTWINGTWDQRRFPDASWQEQSFFNLCMKESGYELVPVPPDSAR